MSKTAAATKYADGYLTEGDANSTNRLISSLAFMLREKNYVGLYDTSVMFSPEEHLLGNRMGELDRDLLFRAYVFLNGMARTLDGFANLIVVREVADQISRMVDAAAAALTKRRNEYQGLSAPDRAKAGDQYQQMQRLEPLLGLIGKRAGIRAELPESFDARIHDVLREVFGALGGDGAEVAARALHEMLVGKKNVAVYSRDPGPRTLIEAFFKLMNEPECKRDGGLRFVKHLDYFNVVVLQYDPAKKVYRRFFESSTDRTSARLSKPPVGFAQQLLRLDELLREAEGVAAPEPKPKRPDSQTVRRAMRQLYDRMSEDRPEVETLEAFRVLALEQSDETLLGDIDTQIRTRHGEVLDKLVNELEVRQSELQRSLSELVSGSAEGGFDLAHTERLAAINTELRETILHRRFLVGVKTSEGCTLGASDFERYKQVVDRLRAEGHPIDKAEVCMPTDEIARLTGTSHVQVIERIERIGLRHEGTRAFLTIDTLIHFL